MSNEIKQMKEGDFLEVGDVVYQNGNYQLSRQVITRVTDKRAFSGYRQMEREVKNGWWNGLAAKAIGESSISRFYIETVELRARYETEELISKARLAFSNIHSNHIKADNAQKFIDFAESITSKKQPQ